MTIRKGTHAPIRFPKFMFSRPSLDLYYLVRFTHTCRYYIGIDQSDINKLFGVGYFTWKIFHLRNFKLFGVNLKLPWFRPMHHVESVRFGWRFDPYGSDELIEILAYWYRDGKRMTHPMSYVEVGVTYGFEILSDKNTTTLSIFRLDASPKAQKTILTLKRTNLCYLLRPYFGGNRKAPNDIEISIIDTHGNSI